MIGQGNADPPTRKGPLIAAFGYEKSDTRLYHIYRSNMPTYYAFDTMHTLTMATTATFKSKKRMVVAHHPIQFKEVLIEL
jgi:hypothetical protein